MVSCRVMYVCMYVRMYVCMYVRTYVCMYVRTYVCMYVRTYVCMYVCMYFQYDLEMLLVVSRKCVQNILHLRKFPSNSPFPGLYVKFRMKHQLSVDIIFKILCQYWKIVSVGPFPEFGW